MHVVGTMNTMSVGGVVMFFAIEALLAVIGILACVVTDKLAPADIAKWIKIAIWIIIGAIMLVRLIVFVGVT